MSRALMIVLTLVLLCATPSTLSTPSEDSTAAAGPVMLPVGVRLAAGPLFPFDASSEVAGRLIAVGPLFYPQGVVVQAAAEMAGRLIAVGPLFYPEG